MGASVVGVRSSARPLTRLRAAGAGPVVESLRDRALPGSGALLDEVLVTLGGVLVLGASRPEAEEHAERLRWLLAPELEAAGLQVRGLARPRPGALRRLLGRLPVLTDQVEARRLARRADELLTAPATARTPWAPAPARPGLVVRTAGNSGMEVRDAMGRRLGRWRPWDGELLLDDARYDTPVRLALGLPAAPTRRSA